MNIKWLGLSVGRPSLIRTVLQIFQLIEVGIQVITFNIVRPYWFVLLFSWSIPRLYDFWRKFFK